MIDYRPLFVTLAEQGRDPADLYKNKIISRTTLQHLRANKPTSTATLDTLCGFLGVSVSKIIAITPDAPQDATEGTEGTQ